MVLKEESERFSFYTVSPASQTITFIRVTDPPPYTLDLTYSQILQHQYLIQQNKYDRKYIEMVPLGEKHSFLSLKE